MKERADIVVSWSFASVPEAVKESFTRPTRYVVLPTPPDRAYHAQVQALGPNPIRAAIRKYAPDVSPTRVALLGFSESCHGVRNLLSSHDAEYVDAVFAIDGIHTPYVGKKQVDANTMLPWLNFAAKALLNVRLFVDTYSSVLPPNFASTTETADWLWSKLTVDEPPVMVPPVPPIEVPPMPIKVGVPPAVVPYTVEYWEPPWLPFRRMGGAVFLGCKNRDGPGYADHIYQAKAILPAVLKALLAERWNAVDPAAPDQACFLGIVTPNPCAQSSILPEGWEDEEVPLPKALGKATWGDIALGLGLGAAGALGLRWYRGRHG